MALPFYNWSKTAASNATADSTVNWSEGQAPSTVNDSGRAMMASTAAFRDDIAGAIATGGTSTAYTVTSFQAFDSLAHLNGQMVAFTPHATNGATVTLNVDGLGAKPLRPAPSTELVAGALVQGVPYTVVYNNSDAVFYLRSFFGNPAFSTGDGKFSFKTVADPGWVMMDDQAIGNAGSPSGARANADTGPLFTLLYNNVLDANAPLFTSASVATTRAAQGSAAAAFAANCALVLPRQLGRAIVGAGTGSGLTARPLGSSFGGDTATLVTANLPAYTPSGSVSSSGSGSLNLGYNPSVGSASGGGVVAYQRTNPSVDDVKPVTISVSSSFTGTAQGGTSTAFSIAQASAAWNVMVKL